jgi:hypothetical protein
MQQSNKQKPTATEKRSYLKQTDVPSASLEDALRIPAAIWVQEAGKLAPLATEASLAAKEEFGVVIDKERYKNLTAETSKFFKEQADESLRQLEASGADTSDPQGDIGASEQR